MAHKRKNQQKPSAEELQLDAMTRRGIDRVLYGAQYVTDDKRDRRHAG